MSNLTNTTLQTVAGSILATSARYASWAATVNGVQPWDGAFDSPLRPSQVLALMSPYVASCPQASGSPFTPSPNLTIYSGARGSNATFDFNNTSADGNSPLFAVFYQGLSTQFVPLVNHSAIIPENLSGITYAVITNSSTTVSDNTTVAGPAVLNLSVPMNGTNSTGEPPSSSTSSSAMPSSTASSSAGSSSSSMSSVTSSTVSSTPTSSATTVS
ncbi:putative ferritin-like domain containing protein [Lyophyllum shimeji]|uniref:Ferritin-like domain containing protein n=1 Tax=Lyophyllum shimeji TaxID=47721 RepID=A0A9P3Q016_LYOSH|nr:putative ferritin-like domain containing protein [Lyophyllum shimeji]